MCAFRFSDISGSTPGQCLLTTASLCSKTSSTALPLMDTAVVVGVATALFVFPDEHTSLPTLEDDSLQLLHLTPGENVEVYEKDSSGWWFGSCGGQQGVRVTWNTCFTTPRQIFPGGFVELLTDPQELCNYWSTKLARTEAALQRDLAAAHEDVAALREQLAQLQTECLQAQHTATDLQQLLNTTKEQHQLELQQLHDTHAQQLESLRTDHESTLHSLQQDRDALVTEKNTLSEELEQLKEQCNRMDTECRSLTQQLEEEKEQNKFLREQNQQLLSTVEQKLEGRIPQT